jgi:tetratricopeptide (TPR) repeat protein
MGEKVTAVPMMYPALIDGRYQVEKILGQGGMAVVYQVSDAITDKSLALKQLLLKEDSAEQKEVAELFEHEFYILAQLAHPRVIEVYSFDKKGQLPYYTMELLDGGDIRELAPLPWKKACSLSIDICSALGLLHSRRQLHRDLSPRNIRCTRESIAKLIDFGAMTPMGPCKRLIGTPAYTSPEVIGLQSIDARADLYSLGATLYYALTGRNAYRAKSFSELRDVWRSVPSPPSSYIEDIPRELDNLVLSLINLDLMARPVNAAEVMERLSAIAGIEVDDKLAVSRAYLSKPLLVGREEQLLPVRKHMVQAISGNGGVLTIEGVSGVGRSRFLDACVLEGRLAGATVLRADASDGYSGSWGAVSTLATQLLDVLPDVALEAAKPHMSVLGHVFPELLRRVEASCLDTAQTDHPEKGLTATGSYGSGFDLSAEVWGRGYSSRPPPPSKNRTLELETFAHPRELRPRVQEALSDWILEVSDRQCVIVAIDDLHRVDEPSAAFIALLSQRIAKRMLVVAATIETDASVVSPIAIKLIKQSGVRIELNNLTLEQTEKLIRSVFAETPNRRLLSDRLQAVSQGNPGVVMRLTQHMLDKGVIRYQAGSWTLPGTIDTGDLPTSLNEAFKARTKQLSTDALGLAQTMALSPRHRFSYDECQVLSEHRDTGRLIQNLDELVSGEILATDGTSYWLSQQGWVSVLTEGVDEHRKQTFHLRVAEVFEKRGGELFHVGQHLLCAGEDERALDVLINFSESSKALANKDPRADRETPESLPRGFYDTLRAAVELSKKRGRPRKQTYLLQSRLAEIVGVTGTSDTTNITDLLEQLSRDGPLGAYRELGDSVPTQERLPRAFALAQERYDSTPESERLMVPAETVNEMVKVLVAAAGVVYISDDFDFWRTLPSIEPLRPVSPSIEVVEKMVGSIGDGVMGRIEGSYQKAREIVARLDQPDHADLEEANLQSLRYGAAHALGIMESLMGLTSALEWVLQIETAPLLWVNAWKTRKLFYLWQGVFGEAQACQQQIELLQIRNIPALSYRGTHLGWELRAYCCCDDLTGVKQVMDEVEKMAAEYPCWVTVLHYARGQYQRIRGDYGRALEELQKSLQMSAVGQHPNFAYSAGAYVQTLIELERYSEAESEGRRFLQAAQKQDLGFMCNYIRIPLAVAEAKRGNFESAVGTAETAIETFRALGSTGVNLGLAHEARARGYAHE